MNTAFGILDALSLKDEVRASCNDGEVVVRLENWTYIGSFGSFVRNTITKVDKANTDDLSLKIQCLCACMDLYSKNNGGFCLL